MTWPWPVDAIRPQWLSIWLSYLNGHWTMPKIWAGTFLVRSVHPGEDFELILIVKMETRGWSFSNEFLASVITVELWWPEVARPKILWVIFALFKMISNGKIFKLLFGKFSLGHRSTLLCSNVVKFVRQGNCALFTSQKKTKFWLPLKLLIMRGSRPKSARARPQHLAHTVPDFIQIDSLSAEL